MSTHEKVMKILKEVKPTKDLTNTNDIVEGGYIDSFELMLLISTLSDEFGIEITIDEITPENFNSIDAIEKMIEKLK